MTQPEFMKQQYLTLRDEIRESKRRMFLLLIFGALFVPVAGFAADVSRGTFASASIPFVMLIMMLGVISEQNAIIRAGRYLKDHVEPHIDGVTGWEKWLETSHKLRDVDRYFFGSFMLMFLVFYAIGTSAAFETLTLLWGQRQAWIALTGYGIGGVWVLFVWVRHWHSCTSTID